MLTIVESNNGDWIAIYKDDKKVFEDHMIEPDRLLKIAGVSFKFLRMDLGTSRFFPESLKVLTKT
jgi:hypothetical protein